MRSSLPLRASSLIAAAKNGMVAETVTIAGRFMSQSSPYVMNRKGKPVSAS
jgi:hypothetical protein